MYGRSSAEHERAGGPADQRSGRPGHSTYGSAAPLQLTAQLAGVVSNRSLTSVLQRSTGVHELVRCTDDQRHLILDALGQLYSEFNRSDQVAGRKGGHKVKYKRGGTAAQLANEVGQIILMVIEMCAIHPDLTTYTSNIDTVVRKRILYPLFFHQRLFTLDRPEIDRILFNLFADGHLTPVPR